jgi:hypothetical protein
MGPQQLDAAPAGELLQRQEELQAEAEQVIADLDLFDTLGRAGNVRLIGSSVTGLMVWRDLDLQVLSPGLAATGAWALVQPLAAHPRVYEARYINQSGTSSFSGDPRDGRFYFQVYYRTDAGDEWKLDVSFWLSGDPREDEVAYQERLVQRLDPETRVAILWIKSLWVESPQRRDPAYGREVSSVDIYDAALEHGVRTPEEFDAYLAARGKPTRSLDRTDAA